MKAREVIEVLEEIAPPESGIERDNNGLIVGDTGIDVEAIGVTWMATVPALKEADFSGVNFLVVHERVFDYYQSSGWYDDIPEKEKEINIRKKEILEKSGMCIYRMHSNWDCYKDFGVVDSFASLLEFGDPVKEEKFIKTYRTFKTLEELAEHVKEKLMLNYIEVHGNLNRNIFYVTPLIGGFGGNQRNMPEVAKKQGSDALIVGDLVEPILIQALELDLSVLKTPHSKSEIPGIKNLHKVIEERFPDIETHYIPSGSGLGFSYVNIL